MVTISDKNAKSDALTAENMAEIAEDKTSRRDYVAEFRAAQAEKFVDVLKKDGLSWVQHWQGLAPMSGATGRTYEGINQFSLRLSGHEDPRWYTFNQIADSKGNVHPDEKWTLKKGSRSEKVEYWFPFDKVNKKAISWAEFAKLRQQDDFVSTDYGLRAKHFSVFNAEDIEGIGPYIAPDKPVPHPDRAVADLAKGMGVPVSYDGADQAYYVPKTDSVHLPDPKLFDSPDALAMTTLHELSHASGHPSRMNRPLAPFDSLEGYAKEELVAEIASVFMAPRAQVTVSPVLFENSEAYVQSWVDEIEKKPEALVEAIRQASAAAAFMDAKLQLVEDRNLARDKSIDRLVDQDIPNNPALQHDTAEAVMSFLNAYDAHRMEIVDRDSLIGICGANMKDADGERFTPGEDLYAAMSTVTGIGDAIARIALSAVEHTQAFRVACLEQKASIEDGTLQVNDELRDQIAESISPDQELELVRGGGDDRV
jgi:antirestriction protein ArdC